MSHIWMCLVTHIWTSQVTSEMRLDWFTCVNDLSICVTWLIPMFDMTCPCVWHDSFAYSTRLLHTKGTTLGGKKEKEGGKKEGTNLFTVEIREEFWGQDWRRLYMRQDLQISETCLTMGWTRLVDSLKSWVSFTEYRRFYRVLLQKRPKFIRSLLIVATP